MSATHGSAKATSPAVKAEAMEGLPRSRMEVRSLGYPATDSLRGKAQAVKSPLPSQ